MALQGHAALKYVTGKQLDTSSGRGWTNLLAERWSHNAGELPSVLPQDTELAVLLSGRTLVERQGAGLRQSTFGQRGTAWLCPSGIREEFIHFQQPLDDCLHLFLPGIPFADTILQDLDLDPARVSLRYEAINYDPFIEQVALAVSREMSAETSAGRLLVESLGLSLSAYLVHRFPEAPLGAKSLGPLGKPIDHQRMTRVLEFIDARIDQPFTVADLATVACMSPAHFARSFKTTVGRSPHQFVSRMRLELAKQMLADRDRSIVDIALSTGFSSQSNFSRAFRDSTGATPGDYRSSQSGARPLST
ncbi:MAG: helix-turn-helix domain-containing protein [Caulobacteraceae bacterium]